MLRCSGTKETESPCFYPSRKLKKKKKTSLVKCELTLSSKSARDFVEQSTFMKGKKKKDVTRYIERAPLTDSGLPMILATALVASLRMSEAVTASRGTLVNKFKVGIFCILLVSPSVRLRASDTCKRDE